MQVVLAFAVPILLLEEVLKFVGRRVDHSKQNALSRNKHVRQHSQHLRHHAHSAHNSPAPVV